jgi:hypothetical protein
MLLNWIDFGAIMRYKYIYIGTYKSNEAILELYLPPSTQSEHPARPSTSLRGVCFFRT